MKRIGCYGSLKKGYYNHDRFGKMSFVGKEVVADLQLYLDGRPYPIGVRTTGSTAIEVYDVSDEQFELLDKIESGAGYNMIEYATKYGLVYVWVYPEAPPDSTKMIGLHWLGESRNCGS